MPDTRATQTFQSASESANSSFKYLFLISLILNIVFSGGFKYMLYLIRSLQMVLHLPMMWVVVPGNVSMLMSIIFPIVMFDILENDQGIDASMLHNFDEGIPEGVDNELLD
jgi:TRAP-type C4-dicarboxylate transport system permease small subunit